MLSPGVSHRTVSSLSWRGAPLNARDQALTSPWCSHIVPTVIAVGGDDKTSTITKKGRIDDLDFYIGDEAIQQKTYRYASWRTLRFGCSRPAKPQADIPRACSINYPVRHGQVDNWDHMERFWQRCIFEYLRCEPEDHYFLLTEPPLNAPENREYTAEIMFETFNVKGLYIAVQAVLALAASWTAKDSQSKSLTGCVVDSGDGVTHVIPVAEGYVIGSSIKSMPVAGRDMTLFVQQVKCYHVCGKRSIALASFLLEI